MNPHDSVWMQAMEWLQQLETRMPAVPTPELPAESEPDFWFQVSRAEMSTRDTLSAKLRSAASTGEWPAMTPAEAWMARRRSEWAAQLIRSKAADGMEPDATLPDVLEWLLVASWESDGCLALWSHAERGGQPHPDNPEGLTPS